MADGDLLPPAIQEFIADVSKWAEGIEEMIADDESLIEMNERATASIEAMQAAIDEAASGAAVGAEGGLSGGATAEESEAASEAARVEALSMDDLAAAIGGVVDASGKLHAEGGRFITQADAVAEAQQRMAGMSDEAAAAFMEEARAAKLAADANRLFAETDELLARGSAIQTEAMGAEAAGMKSRAAALKEESGAAESSGGKWKIAGVAAAVGIYEAVKAAGNFQTQITRLQTSAGELHSNLKMVSAGILEMSSQTNTSTEELAKGMYYVESAGFHGAHGLQVLKAAAEGAQAEGADMVEVSDALTTSMTDYGAHSNQATTYMNMMIAAVAHGKTTLQAFSSSLSNVLPTAAKLGIGFAQIGGAMATMTAQGMSARQASQNLRHALSSLANPTAVQTQEMGQLGLSSTDVATKLGKRGLTGTLELLEKSVLSNMKGGTVLLKAFNQSKLAAQSANSMIASMPPNLQKLGKAYLDGSISASAWKKQVISGNLPANMANLMQQFAATANKAHGFNAALRAGQGDRQTFIAAMSKMTGGMTGAQVAMMLGGQNAGIFAGNVKLVGDAAKHTGKDVDNWKLIQSNFNFQLGAAEKGAEAAGISIGQKLLPAVTAIAHALATATQWLSKNAAAGKALAVIIAGVLAIALERGVVKTLGSAGKAAKNFGGDLGKLGKLFKGADGEASTFSKAISKIGDAGKGAASMLKNAWSGLTGIFKTAKTATEAQTVAQDAQAASAESVAASTEAETVATEAQAVASESETVATEAATVAQTELDVAMDANPIGLIIIAIAALVIGIIELWKHSTGFRNFMKGMWRDIKAWAVDAWHGIDAALHGIEHVFDAVLKWIKGNWWMLVGILTGPIGAAVAYIIEHWSAVKHAFDDVWKFIKRVSADAWHFLENDVFKPIGDIIMADIHFWQRLAADIGHAWDNIVQWAKDAWHFLQNIFDTIVDIASNMRRRVIDQFNEWVQEAKERLDRAWSDVKQFAGHIVSTIEALGGRMFSAGAHIIEMLAHGIMSAVGAVTSAISNIGSEILHHLPFSPAKKGPLSGPGDPELRGEEIMRRLAQGMSNQGRLPGSAMAAALAKMGIRTGTGGELSLSGAFTSPAGSGGAGGAAGAGQLNVRVDLSNATSSPQWQQGLQKAIQQAVLDYAVRNSGSGLVLPQKGRVS